MLGVAQFLDTFTTASLLVIGRRKLAHRLSNSPVVLRQIVTSGIFTS